VSLDSMVNIAFPAIAAGFRLPAASMRWVIVCYVLLYAVLSFVGGAVGDRIGHRPVFAAGLAGTVAGYTIAAAAPTFGWLLMGRVVQGIGSGLVYGTAPAIITTGAQRGERARRLAFLNAALALAFAVGPIGAGVLVATVGWRAVFYGRAPLAVLVLVAAIARLPRADGVTAAGRVRAHDIARRSVLYLGFLPFLAFGGSFAIWLLAPFYLVERRGLGPQLGGLVFMLTPLGMTLGAPLAARVSERLGVRIVVVTGLLVEAVGLAALGTAGPGTPLAAVTAELVAAGLGLGVFVVPNMAALMEEFGPHQQGAAGGFAFMARTLGIVIGVLAWAEIFEVVRGSRGFDVAFERALLAAGGSVLVAAALAALRPEHRAPR